MRAILKQVELWPVEERAIIARELAALAESRPSIRKPTLDELVGAGRGVGPPPSDDECERWLNEHRVEKHGR